MVVAECATNTTRKIPNSMTNAARQMIQSRQLKRLRIKVRLPVSVYCAAGD